MKERISGFLKTYVLFTLLFVTQKPLFMGYYRSLYADTTASEWWDVMVHGLPLDLSLAGYLTALPALFYLCSAWGLPRWLKRIWRGYFLVVSLLLAIIVVTDLGLYAYWGFRLDATPLFYFFSSPKDAVASVTPWTVMAGVLAMVCYAALLYTLFHLLLVGKRPMSQLHLPYRRVGVSTVMLVCTALLFIPIRGGFTVSTMNVGKVYFSTSQILNHAAINPAFSLMESLAKQHDFASQYRFMPDEEATTLCCRLLDQAVCPSHTDTLPTTGDSLPNLLRTTRPDICLIIMESFSSHLMATLGGETDVAVRLDTLSNEGVLFSHFYANSFRTDRGLVAILSGYPAQPTTSLMKYPRKTQSLPSLAGTLKEAGYQTHYYYGGDADFTNMRSYLRSSGFETIVSDQDFPLSERLSKWGVHDHLVFRRLMNDLSHTPEGEHSPQFCVLQTSSSHEPFEVPYQRLTNKRLNAFAYTDSCIGDFVHAYKQLPRWRNTLLILVPDHLGGYPQGIDNLTEARYKIPMLWIGGAIQAQTPYCIDTYGSQHDLAATLLARLGIAHDTFTFSKDMLNPNSPHFAFFTVPDAMGMATPDNCVIFDCQSEQSVVDNGPFPGHNLPYAKAYLQKLYDDIAKR